MFPFKSDLNEDGTGNDVQWPLNHAAYQNINADHVDWAALAQQWIHMKTIPSDPILVPPPPPNISKSSVFDEQGEAPMEVEKEDEQLNIDFSNASSSDLSENLQSNWNSQWNSNPTANFRKKHTGWNTWTNPNVAMPPNFSQSNKTPLLPNPLSFSSDGNIDIPSDNNSWSTGPGSQNFTIGLNNNIVEEVRPISESSNLNVLPQPLDAAKRKTLPLWIRQGLEKMERDKQREAEKEQEARNRKKSFDKNKFVEQEPLSEDVIGIPLQIKSKFDSDSEDEDDKNRTNVINEVIRTKSNSPILKKKKSNEEILQELMHKVRVTLTEILLEVTNEEIISIANETLKKNRFKAQTTQSLHKTTLTSLTGGLGLDMYSDSDDSDDSNSNDSNAEYEKDNSESDLELQETIKHKKKTFEEKSREIEAELAEAEEKEKQWLDEDKQHNNSEGILDKDQRTQNKDIGEIPHEKNSLPHGRERKTTRFSDPKDMVHTPYESVMNVTTLAVKSSTATTSITTPSSMPHSSYNFDDDKNSNCSSNSSKRNRNTTKSRTCYSDCSDNDTNNRSQSRSRDSSSHRRRRRRSSRSSSYDKRGDRHSNKRSDRKDKKSSGYRRSSSREERSHKQSRSRSRSDMKSARRSHDYTKNSDKYGREKSRTRSRSRDKKMSRHRHRY